MGDDQLCSQCNQPLEGEYLGWGICGSCLDSHGADEPPPRVTHVHDEPEAASADAETRQRECYEARIGRIRRYDNLSRSIVLLFQYHFSLVAFGGVLLLLVNGYEVSLATSYLVAAAIMYPAGAFFGKFFGIAASFLVAPAWFVETPRGEALLSQIGSGGKLEAEIGCALLLITYVVADGLLAALFAPVAAVVAIRVLYAIVLLISLRLFGLILGVLGVIVPAIYMVVTLGDFNFRRVDSLSLFLLMAFGVCAIVFLTAIRPLLTIGGGWINES